MMLPYAWNLALQHVRGRDGAWVQGSRPLLSRMVDNVLDNAIGHNRDGGWIRVATAADDKVARLVVENGGDVLDPAQVAGLAQPFRRLGADDYLGKPFHFPELVLRIRALDRRQPAVRARTLRTAGIELDPARRTVTRDGRLLNLSVKEFGGFSPGGYP